MIYDANTTQWQKGDLVIHDSDAKTSAMLMVVIGYDKDTGAVKTRYVRPQRGGMNMRGVFRNDLRYLHDPKRFNIELSALARAVSRKTKGESDV